MGDEEQQRDYVRSLNSLQEEVAEWSEENFPDQPAENPLLGVGEEYGELTHAVLKDKQGIRLDEADVGPDAEKDAVGDIVVFLADFCSRRGYTLGECVEAAWEGKVSTREWESEYRTE